MPLLRFDLIQGWTADEVKSLLDTTHAAVLSVFGVPTRDRYQIVEQHPPIHFLAQDTGLGFIRSKRFVLLQITTRPRSREQKQEFYRRLCRDLSDRCGLDPQDLMISIVENADEDWSFGLGEAQFLTGAISGRKIETIQH